MNRLKLASMALGLAILGPACTTRAYYAEPRYASRPVAYDEGFRHGLSDGRWAGYHDRGHRDRRSFWDDGRYRRGDYGYRREFGPRSEYANGYRAGYEQGYRERNSRG